MNKEDIKFAFTRAYPQIEADYDKNTYIRVLQNLEREIMSFIQSSQPEQLDVNILKGISKDNDDYEYFVCVEDSFSDELQAIDFCTKHGLKVINKEIIK